MSEESPLPWALGFVVCAALFVLCDALAAHWGKNDSTRSLVALIIFSPFAYIAFGYLNKKFPLSIVSAWVVLAVCVSSILMGIYLFDDKITGRQGIGLALAVIAVLLLLF